MASQDITMLNMAPPIGHQSYPVAGGNDPLNNGMEPLCILSMAIHWVHGGPMTKPILTIL